MPIVSDAMWKDMLSMGAPLVEKMVRPLIVYVAMVILLRVFGKRELAQLNPFDLVVLLSLSNTLQNAIIGNDNSITGGVIGALTLLGVNYIVVRFLFRHRRLDQVVEGKSTTLIEKGRMCQKNLARELMTHSELMTVLHRQGFSTLDEVEECVLEPSGTFAVKRKDPAPSDVRHDELIQKLTDIDRKLAHLAAR